MTMQPSGNGKLHIGIATKIAFVAWLIALVTLFIFVAMTIPQQKKNYLESLNSKSNSVAVSLYDVAAGAAINDDLASVVSACQTLLNGDPEISFLIVTKNDGFSLVNQQSGWRVEPEIGDFWVPQNRVAKGNIVTVPLLDQEAYHYSKPFDYSGIQWGWIHVGLSLDRYHEHVQLLYRNTLILTLACIFISLLCAILFSRQLVRPILNLRHIVEQVAGGDLSVRAEENRKDELGSLSSSVNTMITNLIRRNQVLETVRFSAQHFMQVHFWEDAIDPVLEKFGKATEADRVSLFLNGADSVGEATLNLRCEWHGKKGTSCLNMPDLQMKSYPDAGLTSWLESFEKKQCLWGQVDELSEEEKTLLESCGVQSFIAAPIHVAENWFGFLRVDSAEKRQWTGAELDSLLAIAEILGTTILRQQDRSALVDAKQHLEERVEQRTFELKRQVEAKEQALDELAEAQSSLVEMSRAAGMAEVATGVLHNVGNVLNSVNVSCNLIVEQLNKSRVENVEKVAELIKENEQNLAQYLTADERGRQIPEYLISLAPVLKKEHSLIANETASLRERIDHIKEIVSMQQNYGQVYGVYESITPSILMEDALRLNEDSLLKHEITVNREYEKVELIVTDKHRVLQVLLNLVQNATYACSYSKNATKIVTVRLSAHGNDFVAFQVQDNGVGIQPENLTKIFHHGFTTRKDGHGFGLHSGAITAKELGGSLTVQSDGIDKGATFTLILPTKREDVHVV
ncbi:GAF domain-containing protein [Malonomonas rubra DSM 5091]|uniref:histidine kinase n=1 Tax=Malonomonas rubra DSM 5091 TaxID=1122189 RepID=A0A1M6NDZ5_MALRU|nr:ATP-binding protein [Malonomonas rubra]SHJ93937.1 GAF domain-containing protein [Malonomonas rubra DSM 5091]